MFGVGFWEMLVIAVLVLIAVGPDRLPSMIKSLARTYRQLRRTADELRASSGIDDLLRDEELRELAELRKQKLASLTAPPKKVAPVAAGAAASASATPSGDDVKRNSALDATAPDLRASAEPMIPARPIPETVDDPAAQAIIAAKLAAAHAPPGAPVARGNALAGEIVRGATRADRLREFPIEGVDIVEARRFDAVYSEAEMEERRARVAAKLAGVPYVPPTEAGAPGGGGTA